MQTDFYKRWMYHQDACPTGRIIHTQEQLDGLGDGWVDTPAKFGMEPAAAPRPKLATNPVPTLVADIVDDATAAPSDQVADPPATQKSTRRR